MNRRYFMERLERCLSNVPDNEKNDALIYYRDYFDDAGITDDMIVPESVGTPEQIADRLKQDIGTKNYYDNFKNTNNAGNNNTYSSYNNSSSSNNDNTKLIVAIIIAIVTFPIWIGIIGTVFGLMMGIIFGLGGATIGLVVGGIAVIIGGTIMTGISFAGTFLSIGVGLILIGIGFLLLIPLVLFCGKFLPWIVIEITNLCKSLFGRKEKTV